jgi:hypothetical protein
MFQIGENTFNDQKHKIQMKILEFKRSGIGIIADFRGIPSGFPNQAGKYTSLAYFFSVHPLPLQEIM